MTKLEKRCAYGKKDVKADCKGTCLKHYKCRSCGGTHERKKEV